jgi:hypothetical protein
MLARRAGVGREDGAENMLIRQPTPPVSGAAHRLL